MEEKPQQRRRFQFSLRTLLFTCLAFHLSIGFVGATSFVAFRCGYQWFGIYWMSSVRRFLIDDWGWSTKFVCSYGTFSMDALPTWIVLAPICFLLGLARSKYAHIFAWAIAAAMAQAKMCAYLDLARPSKKQIGAKTIQVGSASIENVP